jgi:hypothetical protein
MRIRSEIFNPCILYRLGRLGILCLPKAASGGGVAAVVFPWKITLCRNGAISTLLRSG